MRDKLLRARKFAHYLLAPGSSSKGLPWLVDMFILVLIIGNVLALMVDSVDNIPFLYKENFVVIEVLSIVVFTLEYVLRLWSCVDDPRFKKRKYPRLAFMISFFGVIDLVAVLPFYISYYFDVHLQFLLVLRLFKLVRYFKALQLMGKVIRSKGSEMLIALFFTIILLVFVSFLMFFVEHPEQPDVFTNIPQTLWWGIITLTTVGYGDMYPITPIGQVLGGCIAILGVGLFALPAGILASGFSDALHDFKQKDDDDSSIVDNVEDESFNFCPHCGKSLKEH